MSRQPGFEDTLPRHDYGGLAAEQAATESGRVEDQPAEIAESDRARQEREHRWGHDLFPPPPAETPVVDNPGRPWEHGAKAAIRCTELPAAFRQALDRYSQAQAKLPRQINPPYSEGPERAALAVEDCRLRFIERFYAAGELQQEETSYEELWRRGSHEIPHEIQALEAKRTGLVKQHGPTIDGFESRQHQISQLEQLKQTTDEIQGLNRGRDRLSQERRQAREKRDDLSQPGWNRPLRKLGLVRPSTRRHDQDRLNQTRRDLDRLHRYIDACDNKLQAGWRLAGHPANRPEFLQDADQRVKHLPGLVAERDRLQPEYDQVSQQITGIETQIQAGKDESQRCRELQAQGDRQRRELRDRISRIDAENQELLKLSQKELCLLSTRVINTKVDFDKNGQPVLGPNHSWRPGPGVPEGVRGAADHRRLCAEELAEAGYRPNPDLAKPAPEVGGLQPSEQAPAKDYDGYNLIQYEQTPFKYKGEAIPAELADKLAVHCADLDQGYWHQITILSSQRDLGRGREAWGEQQLALLVEDCRRREIDRYSTLRQHHQAKQEYSRLVQEAGIARERHEAANRDLRQLEASGENQIIGEFEACDRQLNDGQQLRRQAARLKNRSENLDHGLDRLRVESDKWQRHRQDLEPTWRRNPLRKLGLCKEETKQRFQRQQEKADEAILSLEAQRLTGVDQLTEFKRRLQAVGQDSRLQKLDEAAAKRNQLKPNYDKASSKRDQLKEWFETQRGLESRCLDQANEALGRIETTREQAEKIYAEIHDFFHKPPEDYDGYNFSDPLKALISSRTKLAQMFNHPDGHQTVIIGGGWQGPGGEQNAAKYRRDQAARARGLDPETMAVPPGP